MSEVSTSFFSCKQEQLLCTYTEVNTSSLGYMYSMLLKEKIYLYRQFMLIHI